VDVDVDVDISMNVDVDEFVDVSVSVGVSVGMRLVYSIISLVSCCCSRKAKVAKLASLP
jgi:hypothetical protein